MGTYNVHAGHSLVCRGASGFLDEVNEDRKVKTKLLSSLEKRGIQYTTVQTMLAMKEETWQILLRNAINMRLILISQFILMQVAAQDQKYGYTVIS